MAAGKKTPLHVHPESDEMLFVLEGEIIVHVEGGVEHRVRQGDFALALRGVPHAFMATTETRLLCMQNPWWWPGVLPSRLGAVRGRPHRWAHGLRPRASGRRRIWRREAPRPTPLCRGWGLSRGGHYATPQAW